MTRWPMLVAVSHEATFDATLAQPLAVALGAICGALSRYYLTIFWTQWQGTTFPYGTLWVNATGAFLIGLLATVGDRLPILNTLEPLTVVGFLGAYTTFSSYILEVAMLWHAKRYKIAWIYGLGSPVIGLGMVSLGIRLGRHLS